MVDSIETSRDSVSQLEALALKLGIDSDVDNGSETYSNSSEDSIAEQSSVSSDQQAHSDAYVIVLIDAHSHPLISPSLVTSKLLSSAIRKVLPQLLPETAAHHIRLVIRVFADARLLQSARSSEFRDFEAELSSCPIPGLSIVYTDGRLGLEQDITDAFSHGLRDSICNHILFAAWGRAGYLALLQTPSPKVTVVLGEAMAPGYEAIQLPCGFIHIPIHLAFDPASRRDSFVEDFLGMDSGNAIGALVVLETSHEQMCNHGLCGFPHASRSTKVWEPRSLPTPQPSTQELRTPGLLPRLRQAQPGSVPVNKDGQRLDYYIKHPSPVAKQAFKDQVANRGKPCKWFHLAGSCHHGEECRYDHSEQSTDVIWYLSFAAKKAPCKYGSECTDESCMFGHVCLRLECLVARNTDCLLKHAHGVDPVLYDWVPAYGEEDVSDSAPEFGSEERCGDDVEDEDEEDEEEEEASADEVDDEYDYDYNFEDEYADRWDEHEGRIKKKKSFWF